jgi:hypothetical protein
MAKTWTYDPKTGKPVYQRLDKAAEAEFYAADQTPISIARGRPAAADTSQAPEAPPQPPEE